ncbi:Y-family DNA polymerase [Rheinheimera sp.]|uniref:Y-family DNA polymerase n=1 Tax=Rheinheimera sp. TaxID=1869214 RepID=UPI002FDE0E59
MNTLWLYLRFPSLQLDLLYQELSAQPHCDSTIKTGAEPAICLIDNQKLQVCQLNKAAQQAGICLGHNISMACALVPDVQLIPYQPELEHHQLQQLASLLYLYCADIALDAPAALWLRVDPMLQLYGGLAPLLLLLRQQLPRVHIMLGAGHTAAAARLLACDRPVTLPFFTPETMSNCQNGAKTQIKTTAAPLASKADNRTPPTQLQQLATNLQQASPADCNLAASPLPDDVLQQLSALGIVRLSQLQALPKAELSRRFAKTLCLYLEELSGERPSDLQFYQPPEQFSAQLELLYQCEVVAQLQGPLTLLLKKLQAYLLQRAQHCYLLELQLQLQQGEPLQLSIQSAQGEYQYQRWLTLCQLQLEQLKLKAPVVQLKLGARQTCLRPEQALALFDRSTTALTPAQLQSLLLAKFGPKLLFQLNTVPAHRPDKANQCLPLSSGTVPPLKTKNRPISDTSYQSACTTTLASAWTTEEAADNTTTQGTAAKHKGKTPAAKLQHAEDHNFDLFRPAFLLTTPVPLQEPIQLQPGVERLVSGWWDGQPIERDYQIGRNCKGQWCWLFKDRTGWYVQGYFA